MSTRSNIAIKTSNGYESIYVHWDGSRHGRTLKRHYNSYKKASNLIQMGACSVLDKSIECPKGHTFDTPVNGYSVFYGRDRGEDNVGPRTFSDKHNLLQNGIVYLFEDGKWFVNSGDGWTAIPNPWFQDVLAFLKKWIFSKKVW